MDNHTIRAAASDAAATAIRLMVVDDHTLFRRGLVALLRADGRFRVVAEAGDASEAQAAAQRCAPDVALLDNHLPGVSGVAALPALLRAAPGMRVLMLTMSEDEADLAAALQAGASGYLLKTVDSDELGAAIVRALRGESSISATMTTKLAAAFRLSGAAATAGSAAAALTGAVSRLGSLSARELQTLERIAQGDSNKQIAGRLTIAEATVKIHVQAILRKLAVDSRVQAAALLVHEKASGTWPAPGPGI
jgi:two-component system, NarL family, nitrate/nitrite response regulator NarL